MAGELNPLGINATLAMTSGGPISVAAESVIDTFREAMAGMTQRERVVAFQVLGDFYCQRCGVDQPYGDCQCRKE